MLLLRRNSAYDEFEKDTKAEVREKIRDSFELENVQSFVERKGLDFNDYRKICLATAKDNEENFGQYRFTLDDVDAIIGGVVVDCADVDDDVYDDGSMLDVVLKRKRLYRMLI